MPDKITRHKNNTIKPGEIPPPNSTTVAYVLLGCAYNLGELLGKQKGEQPKHVTSINQH